MLPDEYVLPVVDALKEQQDRGTDLPEVYIRLIVPHPDGYAAPEPKGTSEKDPSG